MQMEIYQKDLEPIDLYQWSRVLSIFTGARVLHKMKVMISMILCIQFIQTFIVKIICTGFAPVLPRICSINIHMNSDT